VPRTQNVDFTGHTGHNLTATCASGGVIYDGATNATDARIIAEYVVGERTQRPDPPASGETEQFLYYHTGHLGSGNVVTDQEGELGEPDSV